MDHNFQGSKFLVTQIFCGTKFFGCYIFGTSVVVAVGRLSGDRLATTLVDRYNHHSFLSFFVQRLRSKRWTYKSKFCFSFFHSVSNFLGFALVKAQPIGTSAPTVRLYTLSYTVLVSRARVGARVDITKNDLGKVSRKEKS